MTPWFKHEWKGRNDSKVFIQYFRIFSKLSLFQLFPQNVSSSQALSKSFLLPLAKMRDPPEKVQTPPPDCQHCFSTNPHTSRYNQGPPTWVTCIWILLLWSGPLSTSWNQIIKWNTVSQRAALPISPFCCLWDHGK